MFYYEIMACFLCLQTFCQITSEEITILVHNLEISQLLEKTFILIYDQLAKWKLDFHKSDCLWYVQNMPKGEPNI